MRVPTSSVAAMKALDEKRKLTDMLLSLSSHADARDETMEEGEGGEREEDIFRCAPRGEAERGEVGSQYILRKVNFYKSKLHMIFEIHF